MSFELKPTGSTKPPPSNPYAVVFGGAAAVAKMMPKIEEATWSCAKSPAPALLAGKVPDDVWASTFDAVYLRCGEQMDQERRFAEGLTGVVGCLLTSIPCCLPCNFVMQCFAAQEFSQQKQAWRKLAQDEQQKYAPYGVQITVVEEVRRQGAAGPAAVSGEIQTTTVVYVGLQFKMAAPIQGEMTRDAGA